MCKEQSELIVRQMQAMDVEQIVTLEQMIFSQPWSKESFLESIQTDSNLYLVVEDGSCIVAYCGLRIILDEAHITNVAVANEFRGMGIAYQMLSVLIELAKDKGVQAFTLEVRVSNERAIHLYEGLGFKNAGIRKNFYEHPNEDGMIMWMYV